MTYEVALLLGGFLTPAGATSPRLPSASPPTGVVGAAYAVPLVSEAAAMSAVTGTSFVHMAVSA